MRGFSALLLLVLTVSAHAAGLECPEIGKDPLSISPAQARLLSSSNGIDVANELDALIARLRANSPDISYDSLTNEALAIYCPLVANASSLSSQEKLSRIWRFDALLREKLSPYFSQEPSSVMARVPLSPEVYGALREKADRAGETPSQFMAALLTKASGDTKGQ